MPGLQRMPWIAVFSAGDETPSTSTMFWPTKAMHSRPVQRPLEKHGHLEWLVTLTARVVSMSIRTWDGCVIRWTLLYHTLLNIRNSSLFSSHYVSPGNSRQDTVVVMCVTLSQILQVAAPCVGRGFMFFFRLRCLLKVTTCPGLWCFPRSKQPMFVL